MHTKPCQIKENTVTVRIFTILATALLAAIMMWTAEQALLGLPVAHAQNSFECTTVRDIPQAECSAFVAIKNANPDADLGDWLFTTSPCEWSRVACVDARVTELYLNGNATLCHQKSAISSFSNRLICLAQF